MSNKEQKNNYLLCPCTFLDPIFLPLVQLFSPGIHLMPGIMSNFYDLFRVSTEISDPDLKSRG